MLPLIFDENPIEHLGMGHIKVNQTYIFLAPDSIVDCCPGEWNIIPHPGVSDKHAQINIGYNEEEKRIIYKVLTQCYLS